MLPFDPSTGWHHLRSFIRLLFNRFSRHQGPQNAASLAFTSLLSLVPMMTVVLALFSAFPLADQISRSLQLFLFENFVPASGEVLQQHLANFTSKASRITGVGSLLLLLVALMMMDNIDKALNRIWEVPRVRKGLGKFLVYWAILSLGPLLVGASVLLTSYLISLPLISEAASGHVGKGLFSLMPIAASALAFSLLYALVPNRHIETRHAVAGGLLAALLFELAKRGFGLFITTFPTYEAIYGTLAALPIFLIWIYLSWLVVLLGAEFTHCLEIHGQVLAGRDGDQFLLQDVVQLLLQLGEAQQHGEALSSQQLAQRKGHWSAFYLEGLLAELQQQQLVLRTDQGDWALARSLSDITLYQLYQSGLFHLPRPGTTQWPLEAELASPLLLGEAALQQALSIPLQRLAATALKLSPDPTTARD